MDTGPAVGSKPIWRTTSGLAVRGSLQRSHSLRARRWASTESRGDDTRDGSKPPSTRRPTGGGGGDLRAGLLVDLHLGDAGKPVLDRILDGDDVHAGAIEDIERRVEGRGLPRPGRTGDEDRTVWFGVGGVKGGGGRRGGSGRG